jgi:transposase
MNNSLSGLDSCGVEVSARTLLVERGSEGETLARREFPNTAEGHQAVLSFLQRGGRAVRVCMESTGLYGLDLALCLQRAGVELMVANPRAARHFAQALMKRSKTDRIDAGVLRQFAARMPFVPWRPPSPAALKLLAVARRLEALTEMLTAEKNRLHAASLSEALPAMVRRDVQRSIQTQQRAIKRLTRAAEEFVVADPELERRYQRLLSIPGFATTSALHTLAELTLLPPDMDVRQWVAYAGLDPRHHTSGSSVEKKPRISKAGNQHLRRALYMPALVAIVHEPHLRAFYHHLLARGKAKMQALVAVMRKLLHAIFGMFKHNQIFDGAKVYTLPPSACPVSVVQEAA